jgi:hypothetical protein
LPNAASQDFVELAVFMPRMKSASLTNILLTIVGLFLQG